LAQTRPKFPAHLSRVGLQEMKRVVRILEERGTATENDYAIAAMYGEVYARWIVVKQQIGDEYMVTATITDNHGTARVVTRLNPLLRVLQACEARLVSR
jgi:phage terminase small subunit